MRIVLFAGLVALFVGAAAWPEKPQPGMAFPGKVERVYDGDTLTVSVELRMHVRMDGVWCPEIRGKERDKGLIARDKLRGLAPDGAECLVWIPFRGDDIGDVTTLGRVVATVWVKGQEKSLNEQMAEMGYVK